MWFGVWQKQDKSAITQHSRCSHLSSEDKRRLMATCTENSSVSCAFGTNAKHVPFAMQGALRRLLEVVPHPPRCSCQAGRRKKKRGNRRGEWKRSKRAGKDSRGGRWRAGRASPCLPVGLGGAEPTGTQRKQPPTSATAGGPGQPPTAHNPSKCGSNPRTMNEVLNPTNHRQPPKCTITAHFPRSKACIFLKKCATSFVHWKTMHFLF